MILNWTTQNAPPSTQYSDSMPFELLEHSHRHDAERQRESAQLQIAKEAAAKVTIDLDHEVEAKCRRSSKTRDLSAIEPVLAVKAPPFWVRGGFAISTTQNTNHHQNSTRDAQPLKFAYFAKQAWTASTKLMPAAAPRS